MVSNVYRWAGSICFGAENAFMKQILQSLKNGGTEVVEVPCPRLKPGHLLIRTRASLLSAGTERMLLEFGRANWLDKARQQPDKVRMVVDKIKTDGLLPTIESVRNKLDQPLPMGYCNAGIVLEVGAGVSGFSAGDRVVSNGFHAEVVSVPKNLCAKIPEGITDEAAAFTVIAAIGLQGIRLAQPTLGEAFVVTGLGLIGLVTVQLLIAQGCRVLGIDFDPQKLELARRFGAATVDLSQGEDPVAIALNFSRGRGVDSVLITASTKSSEPVHQAAQMCRTRGRIVLVGVTGLELSRADFYKKELSFQVSCSYGPGRYDPAYEESGQDYPFGFVRWTEQRNFEAVLDLLATRRLEVEPLISHRFPFDRAGEAYRVMAGTEPSLGIVLGYPAESTRPDVDLMVRTIPLVQGSRGSQARPAGPVLGVVGAGNYASQVLIPAFKAAGAVMKTVASSGGASGAHAGRRFGFEETTTDIDAVFSAAGIDTVIVATRHDSHADLACRALKAGKNVFVEKPLAIAREQLDRISDAYHEAMTAGNTPRLMVGFNRRFAPQVQKMKELLRAVREPKSLIMTVNAGAVPADHWTQDPESGGGRLIGESCHFIDLLRFLVGVHVDLVQVAAAWGPNGAVRSDEATFTLKFVDGSIGTVHYFASGHKSFPKERLEVFCAGRILQLDNFRSLRGYGWPGFSRMNLWRQDKGQKACAAAFIQSIRAGEQAPIPFNELVEVTRLSFEVAEAAGR